MLAAHFSASLYVPVLSEITRQWNNYRFQREPASTRYRLMYYARHATWKRSFTRCRSLKITAIRWRATTTWSGPREPFLKGPGTQKLICRSLKPAAYKASLIPRRLHWPEDPSGLCSPEEFHVVARRKKAKREGERKVEGQRRRWSSDLGVDLSSTFAPFLP